MPKRSGTFRSIGPATLGVWTCDECATLTSDPRLHLLTYHLEAGKTGVHEPPGREQPPRRDRTGPPEQFEVEIESPIPPWMEGPSVPPRPRRR